MEVSAVIPDHTTLGKRQNLTLLGEGFGARYDTLTVDLAVPGSGTVAASVMAVAVSDRVVGTNPLPTTLPLGLYDLTASTEDGTATATRLAAFTVVASTWLTVDSYKSIARITDTTDDVAISAIVSAVDYNVRQLVSPRVFANEDDVPGDVAWAGWLLANRWMARRNSPDGVVGVADLGTANILSYDSDIRKILGPHLRTVLA